MKDNNNKIDHLSFDNFNFVITLHFIFKHFSSIFHCTPSAIAKEIETERGTNHCLMRRSLYYTVSADGTDVDGGERVLARRLFHRRGCHRGVWRGPALYGPWIR